MHERRDAERRESRLEGYKKGWFRTGEIRNEREILDRRGKGQLGGRTAGMQDSWDAGLRDSGLDGRRKGGFMK